MAHTIDKGDPAYRHGENVASQLCVGAVFNGALPEADARGFGGIGRTLFIAGFLDAIERRWPHGVTVDREGCIL